MMNKYATILLALLFIFLSCDDAKDIANDNSFDVNIITPMDGESIISYPILISLSISNTQNISHLDIKLNGTTINQLFQFNSTESITYSPPPDVNLTNADLSVIAYSNLDGTFVTDSIIINISTTNYTLINNTIALLSANDFLFTKHLISNQLYVNFLNELNTLGSIISSNDSTNWVDNFDNVIINIDKTHLIYNSTLNRFDVQDGYQSHPISGISWFGAKLFSNHMGWNLPTVEQWKTIARGDSVNWEYPYGDGSSLNQMQANYGNQFGSFLTTEVGSFNERSFFGASDIVGNVWEFTTSNHASTNNYILVGGGYQSPINNLCLLDSCFTSTLPSAVSSTFGFRCVTETSYSAPALDCNNDVSDASIDDCGDCTGGLTGITYNSAMDFCGICDGDGSSCADCNGVQSGAAIVDECGICTGGNTGLIFNYLMDCAGNCNGDSVLDQCETCDNDSNNDCIQDCAGIWGGDALINSCNDCICQTNTSGNCQETSLCGCFEQDADNFICHIDPISCYENSNNCCKNGFEDNCVDICTVTIAGNVSYSNPLIDDSTCSIGNGCTFFTNEYFGQVTNDIDSCEYWGCTDCESINYNEDATNCTDGTLNTCCNYTDSWDGFLSLEDNQDGTYNILMQNNEDIGGFQIDISGATILNASSGSATDAGFMISSSSSTVLGFSITGAIIPQSEVTSTLVVIELDETTNLVEIVNAVMSDVSGGALLFNFNECP